jgi:hypothetical protein
MTPSAQTKQEKPKPADQPPLEGAAAPAETPAEAPPAPPSILPTEKTKPSLTADSAKVFLYGEEKIGKTTTAAALDPEHTLLLATEEGYGALEAFVKPIGSWEEFRAIGPELLKGGHPFKTIVIDTVDELLKLCTDKVLQDLGVSYAGDLEFGKGWAAVTDEFRLRVGALCRLGLGVWFISHAKEEEVKTRTGSITVTSPTIGGGSRKWLLGFVDYILLARSEQTADQGEVRVVRTRPAENYRAGGRGGPDGKGVLPDPIPLDAAVIRDAMATATAELVAAPATAEEKKAA